MRVFTLAGEDVAIQAARNYRYLRTKGVTIRKTIDSIIATYCIENRVPLLFSDQDFEPFVEHLVVSTARRLSAPPGRRGSDALLPNATLLEKLREAHRYAPCARKDALNETLRTSLKLFEWWAGWESNPRCPFGGGL